MDFEKHEEEIKEMLEPLKNKKPPAKVMENFEDEVMSKVASDGSGVGIGLVPVLCFGLVLGGALTFFLLKPNVQPTQVPVQEPAIETQVPATIAKEKEDTVILSNEVTKDPAEILHVSDVQNDAQEEVLFNELDEELFILQMLGEDEGLLDDFDQMETDVEFWLQQAPAVGTF